MEEGIRDDFGCREEHSSDRRQGHENRSDRIAKNNTREQ